MWRRSHEEAESLMKGKPTMPCDGRCGFVRALNHWMQQHSVSVKSIAADTNYAASTVYKWLDGSHSPTLDDLKVICEYTRIPMCELVCDRPECPHRASFRNDAAH